MTTNNTHINDAADIKNLSGELLEQIEANAKEIVFDSDQRRETAQFGPRIPTHIYDLLPETLRIPCSTLEDDLERDIFLTCSLPVLAGTMSNVYGHHGDGPDNLALYVAVVAEAGNGKGIARFAKQLGDIVDKRLYARSEFERDRWKERKANGESPETLGPEPLHRSLFVSANSSYRAFVDALQANQGRGVLVDSEILTLTHAQSQEWGNTVDVMLKAWHSETIMLDRKGEKVRIDDPSLSIAITGTPKALRMLIPSTENGLLSRFCIYSFTTPAEWKSQWPHPGCMARDEAMRQSAELLDALHQALSSRSYPLRVVWQNHHWDAHDVYFARELKRVYHSGMPRALEASIKRGGVVAFRIACALAVLRAYERGERIDGIEAIATTDSDVNIALTLTSVFLTHALAFGASLPPTEGSKSAGLKDTWFAALPDEFTMAQARTEADQLQIPTRTIRRWVLSLLQCGDVERTLHGRYRKRTSGLMAVLATLTVPDPLEVANAANKVNVATGTIPENTGLHDVDAAKKVNTANVATATIGQTPVNLDQQPPAHTDEDDPHSALGGWDAGDDPWAGELPTGWTEGSL